MCNHNLKFQRQNRFVLKLITDKLCYITDKLNFISIAKLMALNQPLNHRKHRNFTIAKTDKKTVNKMDQINGSMFTKSHIRESTTTNSMNVSKV